MDGWMDGSCIDGGIMERERERERHIYIYMYIYIYIYISRTNRHASSFGSIHKLHHFEGSNRELTLPELLISTFISLSVSCLGSHHIALLAR